MSAKEMFEKLGYCYEETFTDQDFNEIEYIKYNYYSSNVYFNLRKRLIKVTYGNKTKYGNFTVDVLRAINKQVEELGWNNVKDKK